MLVAVHSLFLDNLSCQIWSGFRDLLKTVNTCSIYFPPNMTDSLPPISPNPPPSIPPPPQHCQGPPPAKVQPHLQLNKDRSRPPPLRDLQGRPILLILKPLLLLRLRLRRRNAKRLHNHKKMGQKNWHTNRTTIKHTRILRGTRLQDTTKGRA